MSTLTFTELIALTSGRLGVHDVPCPFCGPVYNPHKPVLRIWHAEPGFATYYCTRCDEGGWCRDDARPRPSRERLEALRHEAERQTAAAAAERLRKALGLWRYAEPIVGTPAERYLREARGYGGPLPELARYLRPRADYPPAMLLPFGLAEEYEPGRLRIAEADIRGVHLTRLRS